MGEKALEHVKNLFSYQENLDKFEAIFGEVHKLSSIMN